MISSEVRRTLVKSPPELWTELSDPASLARHLGELGEIRITRTEPENLVEWEAEGTTGTVEIAPSGWGTRVTLTVTRELAAEQVPPAEREAGDGAPAEGGPNSEPQGGGDADEGEERSEPQATLETSVETEPQATLETSAESEPQATLETSAESEPQAEPPAGGLPAADAGARADSGAHPRDAIATGPAVETPGPAAERKPAPATEAARRGAGWPRHAHGPAVESDLRAAEALDGPPPEPDGLRDWATQSAQAEAGEPREDRAPEPEAPAAAAPPKRGLFARLFGRRRGRPKKPAVLEEPPREDVDHAAPSPEMQPTASDSGPAMRAGDGELDEDRPDEIAAAPEAAAEPAGRDSEPGHPGLIDLVAGIEPVAETAPGVDGDEPKSPAVPEAAVQAEPMTPAVPEATGQVEPTLQSQAEPEHAQPITPAEPEAPEQAEPTLQSQAGPGQADADPGTVTPVADLAAELRAAEEVAAEQVEAVLTAVLDRLGSAHHRPFSRP